MTIGKPDGTTAVPEQTMTLFDACRPPLVAGKYQVTVKHTVQHADRIPADKDKPTFQKTSEFTVSAPRFVLASSDIYDRYPPADAMGGFSDTLPHIVLTRRTLPWERALSGDDGPPVRPWMALLLLDEDELLLNTVQERKLQSRAAKDISTPDKGAGTLAAPNLGSPLPLWEQDDRCLTIDLPVARFQEIVPRWEDLPYLAHARQLGHTQHMEAEDIDDEGWFAVVVGNRLPAPGKEHRALLVSLEGHEANLPGSPGFRAPDKTASIRLVVLANWRFVNTAGGNFKGLVAELKCGPLRLSANAAGAETAARKAVNEAMEFGYVPLPHQTQAGYHTVAWYRGPLVPHFLPTEPRNEVYACADAALRYDPEQGLFDVSYAAAWQLGRLLALQNQPFARGVCQLKLRVAQEAAATAATKDLCARFGIENVASWEDAARSFFKPPSGTNGAAQPPGNPLSEKKPGSYAAMKEQLTNSQVELPPELRQSLARMFLLHGVPFTYLVPHPGLLPEESLRFFYVDTTWIAALMDGALSIGRTPESRLLLDKAMAGNFLKEVAAEKNIQLPLTTDTVLKVPDAKGSEVLGHVTGFLLRSDLVSGWRGIEVRAEDGTRPLTALRLQRVARDTLLVIYNGHIRKVVITQPPHGTHFAPPKGTMPDGARKLNFKHLAGERSPAKLGAELLQKRVQLTINIDIHSGESAPALPPRAPTP